MAYRGRIAPSPTGYLHLGHMNTFLAASRRARAELGTLVFRVEDIDRDRCRDHYIESCCDDLKWMGIECQEGYGVGGEYGPYRQSARKRYYEDVWQLLFEKGFVYPCSRSRSEIKSYGHFCNGDVVFPSILRPKIDQDYKLSSPGCINWRFRVPNLFVVKFWDLLLGEQSYVCGEDLGDFLIWRKDDSPSYELAVVADDYAMEITEVVRGEDMLLSTARQILIYRALGWSYPEFYHCPLVLGEDGKKLSKSKNSPTIKRFREQGILFEDFSKRVVNTF